MYTYTEVELMYIYTEVTMSYTCVQLELIDPLWCQQNIKLIKTPKKAAVINHIFNWFYNTLKWTLYSCSLLSNTILTLLKRDVRTSAIILLHVEESSLASWEARGTKKKVA